MQATHLIPAAVTGQSLAFDVMHAGFDWRAEQDALAYSIDAPELIVAGNVKAVVFDGVLESTTPRTAYR